MEKEGVGDQLPPTGLVEPVGQGTSSLPPLPVGVTSGAGGTTALSVLKHFTVGYPITLHTTKILKRKRCPITSITFPTALLNTFYFA